MKLLDTCVIIDALRGHEMASAILTEVAEDERPVYVSTITRYELLQALPRGDRGHRQVAAVEHILRTIATLDFDDHAAEEAARISQELRAAGTPIGQLDTMIAGTAVAHGCEVVTRNERHFQRVKHLRVQSY